MKNQPKPKHTLRLELTNLFLKFSIDEQYLLIQILKNHKKPVHCNHQDPNLRILNKFLRKGILVLIGPDTAALPAMYFPETAEETEAFEKFFKTRSGVAQGWLRSPDTAAKFNT